MIDLGSLVFQVVLPFAGFSVQLAEDLFGAAFEILPLFALLLQFGLAALEFTLSSVEPAFVRAEQRHFNRGFVLALRQLVVTSSLLCGMLLFPFTEPIGMRLQSPEQIADQGLTWPNR